MGFRDAFGDHSHGNHSPGKGDYPLLSKAIQFTRFAQIFFLILFLGFASKAAHDEGSVTDNHLARGFVANIVGLTTVALISCIATVILFHKSHWTLAMASVMDSVILALFILTGLYLTKQTGYVSCKADSWNGLYPYNPDAFGESTTGSTNVNFPNWWRSSRPRCIQGVAMMAISWPIVASFCFTVIFLPWLFARMHYDKNHGKGGSY